METAKYCGYYGVPVPSSESEYLALKARYDKLLRVAAHVRRMQQEYERYAKLGNAKLAKEMLDSGKLAVPRLDALLEAEQSLFGTCRCGG